MRVICFFIMIINFNRSSPADSTPDSLADKADTATLSKFITIQYKDLLMREPIDEETYFYLNNLLSKTIKPENVAGAILESEEYNNFAGFLLRCYICLYNDHSETDYKSQRYRLPDRDGVMHWILEMQKQNKEFDKEYIVSHIINGSEFKNIVGWSNDSEKARMTIEHISGKTGIKFDINKYTNEISQNKKTLARVLAEILSDKRVADAYKPHVYIASCYLFILGRSVGNSEFSFYMDSIISSKLTRFGLLTNFILSPEYASRLEKLGCDMFIKDNFSAILPGGVIMEFIKIPRGSFMMGADDTGWSLENEKPVHRAGINYDFFISKYEVTEKQWNAVMNIKTDSSNQATSEYPKTNISWLDCINFLTKMNYLKQGEFRLPSETEWEYAARAGSESRFYFGKSTAEASKCGKSDLSNYAWFCGNNQTFGKKKPGSLKPNKFGLYDIAGNVYEWCEDDWRDSYRGVPADGSARRDDSNSMRVIRGGYWMSYPEYCRSSSRACFPATKKGDHIGFRVVREKISGFEFIK